MSEPNRQPNLWEIVTGLAVGCAFGMVLRVMDAPTWANYGLSVLVILVWINGLAIRRMLAERKP